MNNFPYLSNEEAEKLEKVVPKSPSLPTYIWHPQKSPHGDYYWPEYKMAPERGKRFPR